MRTNKGKAPRVAASEALVQQTNSNGKGNVHMNNTTIVSNHALTVPFHGAELYVIPHKNEPYTPLKPIVTGMGLTWHGQFLKLKSNASRWGILELRIPTKSGAQSMLCMPLRKLPAWLCSIEPGKIRNQNTRNVVIAYQNECDDALWDYWNKGVAVNQRAFNRSNPQWVEVRQAGKLVRQEWGGVVHDFVGYAIQQGSKSAQMYYMNITKMQYQALEFVKQSGDKYFRDHLDILQHSQLMSIELAVQQALLEGMDMELPYKEIYKLAKERALELAVPLKRLTGNARVLHTPVAQRIAEVVV